jgi:hypothetical protein
VAEVKSAGIVAPMLDIVMDINQMIPINAHLISGENAIPLRKGKGKSADPALLLAAASGSGNC